MRKLAILLAAGAAVAATPAIARNGAWYVGGDFGAMIVEDVDFDVGATNDAFTLDHEYGYDGGLFVGYDMGAFRLEAEVAYKRASIEEFDTLIVLPSTSGPHPIGIHPGGGSSSALSFMINGMLDFGDDDGLSGFVGAGAGMAKVSFNEVRADFNDGVFLDDSDTAFAWQAIAGVRHAISPNTDVHLRYRFFNVNDLEVITFGNQDASGGFQSHSLLVGITFNFGQPGQ